MKHIVFVLLVFCAALASASPHADDSRSPKGHLVIIGGGERTDDIMNRFVALAGGPGKAHIIVLSMASSTPDTTGMEQAAELISRGAASAEWMDIKREQAADPAILEKLDKATGIFFSGGDQVRVTRAILGTPVHHKLLDMYQRGAVIGGTSAGAAIMSRVMLTGEELINRDSTEMFTSMRKGNVETIEGLGFLTKVIIDQHFVKRKRLNRLICVVLEHPELPAIGIDESTAILVNPDGTAEVMGQGTVVVLDARAARDIHPDMHGNFSARGILMRLVAPGETFRLEHPEESGPPAR